MSTNTETPHTDSPANILASACPSRTVMRHLTDRWTPMIVAALSEEPTARFSELKDRIQGVSPKVSPPRCSPRPCALWSGMVW